MPLRRFSVDGGISAGWVCNLGSAYSAVGGQLFGLTHSTAKTADLQSESLQAPGCLRGQVLNASSSGVPTLMRFGLRVSAPRGVSHEKRSSASSNGRYVTALVIPGSLHARPDRSERFEVTTRNRTKLRAARALV